MTQILKVVFPRADAVGDGVVCSSTPFSGIFAIDYYDGATEGFAQFDRTANMMYFKKVWWDKDQNNRLFSGYIVSNSNLKKYSLDLFTYLEQQIQAGNWSEPLVGEELSLIKGLRNYFKQADASICVDIFCRNITGELFILPTIEEE
jgi:hypothetical protein